MLRELVRVAVVLAAAGVALVPTRGQVESQARLSIVEPQSGEYLAGPVTLRAEVAPRGVEVTRADFFVDGLAVCRLTSLPLTCAFDAGTAVKERQVRVTVLLKSGERVVASVRTAALRLDDAAATNAVLVPVVVWDWRGRFVPGLAQNQFALTEDGIPQQVQFFQAEDVPLELAFAIDISGSMAPIIDAVRSGLKQFMGRLKLIDRVTLVAFNERVYVLTRSEADQARRSEALDRLAPQGGTAIVDALVRSAELLGQQVSRRAIVAFTDGLDMHSVAPLDAVEARLRNTDIAVYLITYGMKSADAPALARLARLTEATGGRLFKADKVDDVPKLLDRIVGDLSQHYLLGFTPKGPTDGAVHSIAVSIPTRKNYELKHRRSYQADIRK